MDAQSASRTRPASDKKPYASPVLMHWGTMLEITKALGLGGSPDGGIIKLAQRTRLL